jgi:ATP-dependent Clp protease adaptor protein ClpS
MTTETPVIEKKKVTDKSAKEPGKYKVVLVNDDVTPMEFVIAMLVTVFNHDQSTALTLTVKVHNEGSAVAGVYTHEIAEQKALDGTQMARSHSFPLVIKVEAE